MPTPTDEAVEFLKQVMPLFRLDHNATLLGIYRKAIERQLRTSDIDRVGPAIETYAMKHSHPNAAEFVSFLGQQCGSPDKRFAIEKTQESCAAYNHEAEKVAIEWANIDAVLNDFTDDELKAEWAKLVEKSPYLANWYPNVDVTDPKRKGARGALYAAIVARKGLVAA